MPSCWIHPPSPKLIPGTQTPVCIVSMDYIVLCGGSLEITTTLRSSEVLYLLV